MGCPSCHQPSLRKENWETCFPRKGGGIQLSALPKNTTSKLAVLFSTTSFFNAERPAGKLWIPFFKVFWYDSTRRINPRSNNCKSGRFCRYTNVSADNLCPVPKTSLKMRFFLAGNPKRESYRLSTYHHFPLDLPIDLRQFARHGFYFTGYRDRVVCFRLVKTKFEL